MLELTGKRPFKSVPAAMAECCPAAPQVLYVVSLGINLAPERLFPIVPKISSNWDCELTDKQLVGLSEKNFDTSEAMPCMASHAEKCLPSVSQLLCSFVDAP